uniref:Reverse transcriptase domain-containing protein n=1 Tax=Anolis carolinensis TaxID=28377 RepID=A0A803T714_ANOCA
MGDFNGVLNIALDKSNTEEKPKNKKGGVLPSYFLKIKDLNLTDIWRHLHGNERDYTFLSNRHLTWSRINMIWGSKSIVNKITKCKILPRINSDHAPLEVILGKGDPQRGEFRWRLNELMLKDQEDLDRYRKLLIEYFKFNKEEDTAIELIWDASKAYIRGQIMQQSARKKRLRRADFQKIEGEIARLEKTLKGNAEDKKAQLNLDIYKKQLETLQVEDMAKKLRYVKQHHFENANKVGRWLARRINKKKQAQYINKIQEDGKTYFSSNEIGEQFTAFYGKLYKKDSIAEEKVTQYIGKQDIPKITETQRERLNGRITEEEISRAIKKLPSSKAPGPDGFSMLYYKIFQDILVSPLQKVMNKILEEGKVPQTWNSANIVVIPKGKMDNTQVKNYRPISLLNADYKIFASILADRLKEVLKVRIAEDQSGFLPGRQMRENIRNILNVIEYYEKNNRKEIAFLFLDAEKAFDNVNWFCMFEILREMDVGFYFSNAIKAIYSKQTARIITNGQISNTINISKGTRQGCPLSPPLFIMTIEILLNAIRNNKELKGPRTKNFSYKTRAFADDLVCLIEDPLEQFDKWWEVIQNYGEVAGFKINRGKTQILTKNMTHKRKEKLQRNTGIEVVKKIRYLGLEITASNAHLFKNNYERKWKEIKEKMKKWGYLQLSLLGKIATVKMKILPEVNFLFQNLPILKTKKTIAEWHKDIQKFIWEGKKARIGFKYLKDDIKRGGMGLPDLQLYYDAAALSWVKDWSTLTKRKTLALEGQDLRKGWHSYLCREKSSKERNFSNHFLRAALIGTWEKYKKRFYKKIPMWCSPSEAEHMRELPRETWLTYRQLLRVGNQEVNLKSYDEIKRMDPKMTWLNYWQIRGIFQEDSKIGFELKETSWDRILKVETKTIKIIYKQLLAWDTEEVQVKTVMTKWAREIGHTIMLSEWENIWKKNQKLIYATELRENWFKVFYRWYLTPARLAKFNKDKRDGKCWKCQKYNGDFMHMWWGCKRIKKFWQEIKKEMEKILQIKFNIKPEYFLLGMVDFQMDFNTEKLFTYMITAARICIAKLWKTQETPTFEIWMKKLIDIKNMDLLTQKVSQSISPGHWTDWNKLRQYLLRSSIELL